METIRQICVCALLAALTGLAVCAIGLVRAATATVSAVPGEMDATRTAVVGEVRAARVDVLARSERQVAALRRDVLAEAGEMRVMADRRVGDSLARFDAAVTMANGRLGEFTGAAAGLRSDFQQTLQPVGALATQVNEAAPMFLDCQYNADCVFNRYVGVSTGVERAALNFGQASVTLQAAMPRLLTNADSLVADSAATAANIKRLTTPKWYDRLIGYGLNGVVMYRNLNPVTNLTVKGAQFLSSRP
jgi:hypothetical protein